MDVRDKLNLVIYRVRERGLEIFVRPHGDGYVLPEAEDASGLDGFRQNGAAIDLDPVGADDDSPESRGLAIEADYHDIPSLKGLLLDDAKRVAQHLRELPNAEEGAFLAVKSVAKRLLPGQYRMLAELRDILVDRNSTRDL